MSINTDSSAGKAVANRLGLNRKTNVQLKYLCMQDIVQRGEMAITKIQTTHNPADVLTKHLPSSTISSHLERLCLRTDKKRHLAHTEAVDEHITQDMVLDTARLAVTMPRPLDCGCSQSRCQALLFNTIESRGRWPAVLVKCRVTLLHKPDTPYEAVSSWRPITLSSTIYRLYTRICFGTELPRVLPRFSPNVNGGIPGRSAGPDLLRVMLAPECAAQGGIQIWWSRALEVCQALGFSTSSLRGVFAFYNQLVKHTTLLGHFDPTPWRISRNMIQGCSFSVLVTLHWSAHGMAWLMNWVVRFLTLMIVRCCRDAWDEAHFKYDQAVALLRKRAHACRQVFHHTEQFHGHIDAKTSAICTAALPKVAFGMHVRPPALSLMRSIDGSILGERFGVIGRIFTLFRLFVLWCMVLIGCTLGALWLMSICVLRFML
eukprot:6327632-Amphidinium_carterae.2